MNAQIAITDEMIEAGAAAASISIDCEWEAYTPVDQRRILSRIFLAMAMTDPAPNAPAAVLPSDKRLEELIQRAGDLDHAEREEVRAILRSIPILLATARAEGEAVGRVEQWRADREAVHEALRQHGYAGEAVRRILAALDSIKPEGA